MGRGGDVRTGLPVVVTPPRKIRLMTLLLKYCASQLDTLASSSGNLMPVWPENGRECHSCVLIVKLINPDSVDRPLPWSESAPSSVFPAGAAGSSDGVFASFDGSDYGDDAAEGHGLMKDGFWA